MLNYPMTKLSSNRNDANLERARQTNMGNKRWLLVGAYQAGASEKKMAEMAQLPKATVRRILSNFQRTGVPALPPRTRRNVQDMPLVEYDEHGSITNYSENVPSAKQRGPGKPRARDLIAYVLAQNAQDKQKKACYVILDILIASAKCKYFSCLLTSTPIIKEQSHKKLPDFKPNKASPASNEPRLQLMTPPQENDKMPPSPTLDQTLIAPLGNGERHVSLPPSPPLHPVLTSKRPDKHYQDIQGFEPWTKQDDLVLMKEVFSSIRKDDWRDIELKLDGRHNVSMCLQRWERLQSAMLNGFDEMQ